MDGLKIALISTDYPPLCTSAAVQMRDLALEMLRQGHEPIVIIPTADLPTKYQVEIKEGITLVRVAVFRSRDINYIQRTLSELLMPFLTWHRLRTTPYGKQRWDLIVWYSPTIFFGPLVWFMRRVSNARTYLILRDIFPEWALDLGILRKGVAFWFFKKVANLQYAVADIIGVQTPSNLNYLTKWSTPTRKLEVLYNWQIPASDNGSSIQIKNTPLNGRKIVVYIGNMGVAQGMDILIEAAKNCQPYEDIGFIFVGRGSEVLRLKAKVHEYHLTNTLFFDEVDSSEMPGLLSQCTVGWLALDRRHKTHNIPGKFLTYLLAGLPILACVNPGTDLGSLIKKEGVGCVYEGDSAIALSNLLKEMLQDSAKFEEISNRGKRLATKVFSPESIVKQIIHSTFSATA